MVTTFLPLCSVCNNLSCIVFCPALQLLAILYLCFQLWYVLSKILAEEAAWKFVNENNIDMVAINPTMLRGPLLQPEVYRSSNFVLSLINGNVVSWLMLVDLFLLCMCVEHIRVLGPEKNSPVA